MSSCLLVQLFRCCFSVLFLLALCGVTQMIGRWTWDQRWLWVGVWFWLYPPSSSLPPTLPFLFTWRWTDGGETLRFCLLSGLCMLKNLWQWETCHKVKKGNFTNCRNWGRGWVGMEWGYYYASLCIPVRATLSLIPVQNSVGNIKLKVFLFFWWVDI